LTRTSASGAGARILHPEPIMTPEADLKAILG
jgi:hypothetical protein